MKKFVVDYLTKKISVYKGYSEDEKEILVYGLESMYILITKTIGIFTIAYFLGLIKEVFLFTIIYNFIRMPSFGIHAKKSWMCWVSSIIIFISVPYTASIISIPTIGRALIGVFTIICIFKNAPADTEKRPIINKHLRDKYKFISTSIAILFSTLSLIATDQFFQNTFIFALVVQAFMISPLIYKIFKLPYDNYKDYEDKQSCEIFV